MEYPISAAATPEIKYSIAVTSLFVKLGVSFAIIRLLQKKKKKYRSTVNSERM